MPSKKKTGSIRKRASSLSKHSSSSQKEKSPRVKHSSPKIHSEIDTRVAENFIALQKVMVNLASKFDDLSNRITKLLDLFEISARALAEKDYGTERKDREDKKIMEMMNNLSEQNKILARGMTLVHDKLDETSIERDMPRQTRPLPSSIPRPIKPSNNQESPLSDEDNNDTAGYQKSLTSPRLLPSSEKKIGEK